MLIEFNLGKGDTSLKNIVYLYNAMQQVLPEQSVQETEHNGVGIVKTISRQSGDLRIAEVGLKGLTY